MNKLGLEVTHFTLDEDHAGETYNDNAEKVFTGLGIEYGSIMKSIMLYLKKHIMQYMYISRQVM